jgi:hypothetical protein
MLGLHFQFQGVVDRTFADNLPLNGRSFQTLIMLTPGVVMTTAVSILFLHFPVYMPLIGKIMPAV